MSGAESFIYRKYLVQKYICKMTDHHVSSTRRMKRKEIGMRVGLLCLRMESADEKKTREEEEDESFYISNGSIYC